MAYEVTNPPVLLVPGMGGHPSLWLYKDADAHGSLDGTTGYFTDGAALGMKANDIVIYVDTATPSCTVHMMKAATIGAAATLAP